MQMSSGDKPASGGSKFQYFMRFAVTPRPPVRPVLELSSFYVGCEGELGQFARRSIRLPGLELLPLLGVSASAAWRAFGGKRLRIAPALSPASCTLWPQQLKRTLLLK